MVSNPAHGAKADIVLILHMASATSVWQAATCTACFVAHVCWLIFPGTSLVASTTESHADVTALHPLTSLADSAVHILEAAQSQPPTNIVIHLFCPLQLSQRLFRPIMLDQGIVIDECSSDVTD